VVRRHKTDESGAALVEFALLLPVFMMLVLGMFSGGIVYNQKLDLTHATREGARYGAAVSKGQSFSNGQSWASNVHDLVVDRAAGDLSGSNTTVCVALVDGASATPIDANHTTDAGGSNCFPDTTSDTGLRVQVSSSRPGKVEVMIFSQSVTLTAKATAKYEGS